MKNEHITISIVTPSGISAATVRVPDLDKAISHCERSIDPVQILISGNTLSVVPAIRPPFCLSSCMSEPSELAIGQVWYRPEVVSMWDRAPGGAQVYYQKIEGLMSNGTVSLVIYSHNKTASGTKRKFMIPSEVTPDIEQGCGLGDAEKKFKEAI